MDDILNFVIDTYGDKIKKYLDLKDGYGEYDITISFFADSEDLVDSIISEKENMLTYNDFAVKIIQDYSIKEKDGEPLSDLSYCKVNEYNFVKVVTPFTKERAYDFLIGKTEDMPEVLRILKERETKKNFRYNDKAPVIGFDFKEIESETIKFLMNEDFREYCASKFIKLKRGIILEGKPGCLSGGTKLKIRTEKKPGAKQYSIKEAYYKFNNIESNGIKGRRFWNKDVPKFIQSCVNDKLEYKEIEKIIISGEKEVFKLTTETGKKIKCSIEHPFKVPDDKINGRGVKEKDNFVQLKDLMVGEEIFCKNSSDSDTLLCLEKIKSIEKIGVEETFDIVMKDSANFVANNIVVHNTGKTLTLQWLRNQAEKNKISYRQFKTVKEFMESIDEYYGEGKKIFVFEDFDAALMERKETGEAPNQILASVLNTLEGVEEINDVVSIFTTNNIDVFDKAFIRPGRIDRVFRYNLPSKEEFLSFFKAYIPDEKEYFDVMVEHLSFLSADVSYAILKGICDDINIFKFSGKSLTEKELFDIIKQKVTGANKDKTVTNTSKYIL